MLAVSAVMPVGCAVICAALAATPAVPPPTPPPDPGPVASIAWLGRHLDDPMVRVIGTGEPAVYAHGHIPGATFVSRADTLDAEGRLLGPRALARVLAAAGADDEARIVLYGEHPMATGWLYMAFASIGHAERVSLLDGNLAAWRAAGRGESKDAPARRAPGRLTVRPAPDVIVDAGWVRARLGRPGVRILDVRTAREREEGYLPGSALVLWQDLYADLARQTLKPRGEIGALFGRTGVGPGEQAVTYCAVGMRASLMYFAARYAGIPARVYVGSWEDWRRRPENPVTRQGRP
jgi:thiosulfate/3-mercaptopyruvate sulfurtransferase